MGTLASRLGDIFPDSRLFIYNFKLTKMVIKTKGTNFVLTPDVTSYLNTKLQSLDKFIDPKDESVLVDVEIGRTTRHHQAGDIYRAEININSGSKNFRAEAEAFEILAAIDEMKDQILMELRKNKTKEIHFLKKGGQKLKEFLRGFYKRK